jgi:hypothetical protein
MIPSTNGEETYKWFINSISSSATGAELYKDHQIIINLNQGALSSINIHLTNITGNIGFITSNIGTLSSSGGSSMDMVLTSGYSRNFGTDVSSIGFPALIGGPAGTPKLVYTSTTTNNYSMIGYISAPNNPSFGLYVFTIYLNSPSVTNNYSSIVVKRYLNPSATP